MWHQACASAGSIAGHMAPTTPTAVAGSSLAHIMMAGISTEMKTKYCKEKQTDSSASLSILAMSISLALSPDRGHSGQWRNPDVTKLQYAERVYGCSHFPGPERYKKRH